MTMLLTRPAGADETSIRHHRALAFVTGSIGAGTRVVVLSTEATEASWFEAHANKPFTSAFVELHFAGSDLGQISYADVLVLDADVERTEALYALIARSTEVLYVALQPAEATQRFFYGLSAPGAVAL